MCCFAAHSTSYLCISIWQHCKKTKNVTNFLYYSILHTIPENSRKLGECSMNHDTATSQPPPILLELLDSECNQVFRLLRTKGWNSVKYWKISLFHSKSLKKKRARMSEYGDINSSRSYLRCYMAPMLSTSVSQWLAFLIGFANRRL
jgi:hypothetical protein